MNNITSIEELKKIGQGEMHELPPFDNGQKLTVRIRKPDIMMMIIDGKIPNALIEVAQDMTEKKVDLYKDDSKKKIDFEKTKKYFNFLQIIAKNVLVSPTYAEIEEYAGGLNIQQLIAIFEYTQSEVNELKSFRSE